MKKIILTAVLAISTVGLFAQTAGSGLTSKKGEMYLPESGDYAISFDATPFLNYFGNFLSSAGNKAPGANFLNGNQTIMGKYFVDDQTAYRGIVRIGINHWGQDNYQYQDNYTGTPPTPQVVDHWSYSQHFIGLGAGMEKRRGKTRLQGYYGAELMFYLSGSSNAYTYGNPISSTDNSPTNVTNWSSIPAPGNIAGVEVTEYDPGSTFGVNLLGFVGFEYFFCPKISVGAEYTWGLMFSSTGKGSETYQTWNGTGVSSTTINTGGSSSFSFDSGINSGFGNASTGVGNLYINFHF